MAAIDELFKKLEISDEASVLETLSKSTTAAIEKDGKTTITKDTVSSLSKILQLGKPEASSKAAELVAALAKETQCRQILTDKQLIVHFCNILRSIKMNDVENYLLAKQACRALGNLCYENDACREIIFQTENLSTILHAIRCAISYSNSPKGVELRACSVGLLLNFLVGFDRISFDVMFKAIIDILCDLLKFSGEEFKDDDPTAAQCLIILRVLSDADYSFFLNENLCKTLVNMLGRIDSRELLELLVELMHSNAIYAAVSDRFTSAGLCELLIRLLEKYQNLVNDETEKLFKVTCELIILLLNSDESMKYLYDNGKSECYKAITEWLSSDVQEFQITSVLAIANFARADSHCIEMVKEGMDKKLLKILSQNVTENDELRLQHAILSALRNLAVPEQNKIIMVQNGLLNVIYGMLNVTANPVIFKLLGTLRMITAKQENVSKELGRKTELIEKVVEWSYIVDHPGVKGEASRLLSWIIQYSKDKDAMETMIKCKAIGPIVDHLITSDYEVMQIEAINALTLLSAMVLPAAETSLANANLGDKLLRILKNNEPKPEIFSSVVTLMKHLSKSKTLKSYLDEKIPEDLLNSIKLRLEQTKK